MEPHSKEQFVGNPIFNHQLSTENHYIMPMFYTPKPRQFHYKPWFYDPEKEDWEKLKMKYKIESENKEKNESLTINTTSESDSDLEYFQRRVRDIEREERQQRQKMTLMDLFRRREKPTFHYVSRFDAEGNLLETPPTAMKNSEVKRRIQRRFDSAEDWDRFKPIPASKIIVSTLLVFLLLIFIFF